MKHETNRRPETDRRHETDWVCERDNELETGDIRQETLDS